MILAETLPELLKDPHHLAFEAITGIAEFAIGGIAARIWIYYHDRRAHKHEHCEDVHKPLED